MDLVAMEMNSNDEKEYCTSQYSFIYVNFMKNILFSLFFISFVSFANGQVVAEICGVKFGASMREVVDALVDKFGEPDEESNTEVVFYHKSYAGINFDVISFFFDTSRLDKVDFCILCPTKEEALHERDIIINAVGRKYSLAQKKGEMGETDYWGGTHPLNHGSYAFYIGVNTQTLFSPEKYPFRAHLQYGPYGYGTSLEGMTPTLRAEQLYMVGEDLLDKEDYAHALSFFRDCIEEEMKLPENERHNTCLALMGCCGCYFKMGQYAMALDMSDRFLPMFIEENGKDNDIYATLLNNRSDYLRLLGRFEEALACNQEALSVFGKSIGTETRDYALTLAKMAEANEGMDNMVEALRLQSEALGILESLYGRKSEEVAHSLHNMAHYYAKIGNYEQAIHLVQECVDMRKELLGTENQLYATSLATLADYLESLGDLRRAVKIGEEALDIKQRVYGEEDEEYLASLNNLVAFYIDIGVLEDRSYLEKGIELLGKGLSISEKVYGKNNNIYSSFLCLRSQLSLFTGRFQDAVADAEEATDIIKVLFGTNNLEYAKWMQWVVLAHASVAQYDKLEVECIDVSHVFSEIIRRYFATMTRSERAFFWNANKRWFENDVHGITFRLMTDALRVNGYNMALFAKGILLGSEMGLTQLLMESGDQGAINLYRQLQGKKAELESLYSLPVQQRQQDASTLEREVENIEQQLLSISQSFGDYTRVLATEWTDVQRCLQKGDAAIEFVAFPLTADSAMYAAYVVRKDDKAPVFVPLFEQKQIIYNTIEVLSSAPEMSALLWKPLAPYLDNVKNIYFSPCWLLNSIPIESLPGWDGKGWVSDRWKLFRLSSTRELVKKREGVSGYDAVVYGGLKYNTSVEELVRDAQRYPEVRQRGGMFIPVDSLGIRGNQIAELPATAFEAKEVADVMNNARLGVHAQVFEGTAGTEASFKALSGKKKRIIHVATHGFYYLENEVRQSHVTGLLPSAIERQKNAEDKALTRSGLILAGANNRLQQKTIPEGVEDGILTAQEIAMLDLRGLDLVALSACQTAQGDINGEGVFGLQRGFKKAGAGSILMSLWKVDDEATSLLMTEFYKQWINGLSKHDALEKAKMVVRGHQGWSNPNYWAAFVLLDGLD